MVGESGSCDSAGSVPEAGTTGCGSVISGLGAGSLEVSGCDGDGEPVLGAAG